MDHRMTRDDVWAHWPGADACLVPEGLSDERLMRWIQVQVMNDAHHAAAAGRPWSARATRCRGQRLAAEANIFGH